MRSTTISISACLLPAPVRSFTVAPAGDCISIEMQYLFLFIVGIAFLLFIFIYSYKRLIKQKNVILSEHISKELLLRAAKKRIQTLTILLKQHTSTSEIPLLEVEESVSENNLIEIEESKKLYKILNDCVVKQQLYLNPNLTRDNLAQLIHLNKNHFAQMLHKNSGFKLTDYLNNLRIEHALVLLKKHPDHTIQAIATDSGFNNMSTFYMLFKQKERMTPSEYRSALNRADRWQSGYRDYII